MNATGGTRTRARRATVGAAHVPCISEFFGIAVYMYYNDHSPPHFHAQYAEDEATISIDTLETLTGSLPRRARNLVIEWALLHRDRLRTNWDRAREGSPPERIDPLD